MLRLLSRALAARPPLPRGLPALLRAAPPLAARAGFARGLSAVARAPLVFFVKCEGDVDYAEVEVPAGATTAALKKAAMAELRLDASPAAVTLALAAGGPAAPPLDARRSVADAIASGALAPRADLVATVHARAPAFSPLPPPLVFAREVVGGEEMMVALLESAAERDAPARPFFLSLAQHTELLCFALEQPVNGIPRMLMATGTIKSGKTEIVHEILPRLVVAEHLRAAAAVAGASPPAAPPRHPVFFTYTFPLGMPAADAASDLCVSLTDFARALRIPLQERSPVPLVVFPHVIEELARGIHARGGVLWLLLDELQAPIVASTPAQAGYFMEKFKTAVRLASPCARVVGTGSSMLSLLATIRGMPSNGFALWDAVAHVSVGREPPPRAALAMAARIVAAYGAAWPAAAKAFLTPQRFVDALARDAHGELTSARPALLAYMAGLCGNAQRGTPEEVFESATRALTLKLAEESTRDAVLALTRLRLHELLGLRALAVSGAPLAGFTAQPRTAQAFDAFAALLCEAGAPPTRLLPPYGALFRAWITAAGKLAVGFRVEDDSLDLAAHVRKNLVFLADNGAAFSDGAKHAASARVLASLASNGIGTVEQVDGGGTVVRAPATPEEVRDVPAIAGVLDALDDHARRVGSRVKKPLKSPSAQALRNVLVASAPKRDAFMANLGLTVLDWVRNFDVHVWFKALHVHRDGLTGAVVAEAVAAAVDSLLERRKGAAAAFTVDASGILQHASDSPPPPPRT